MTRIAHLATAHSRGLWTGVALSVAVAALWRPDTSGLAAAGAQPAPWPCAT